MDGLDIIQLTGNQDFINELRRLQKVVHDASEVESVNITPDQMREIGVLSSIESNFTENLLGIIIPRNEAGFERVKLLKDRVKSKQWTILAAHDYDEALALLLQSANN